jgi:chorismate mutase
VWEYRAGVGESMPGAAPKSGDRPPALADLRAEIDRIDETMHRLLMERGDIIDRLIAVKKTSESGSAFRPGREAAMMRALAARHAGLLPLDTAESIWRVIIATFTYVQAPFAVHADISGGDAPMRDTARFHFGFTVPYRPHESAATVIAAVAKARGDLGIFRLDQGVSAGAWWRDLVGDKRPKVIARLPFIERPGHPAGTPVFVVSKPLADAAVRDVVLYAASFERWGARDAAAVKGLDCEVIASAGSSRGLSVLLATPGGIAAGELQAAVAGAGLAGLDEIGSHAERFAVGEPG